MLGKPNRQQNFWDSWVYQRLIPQDHLLWRIDELVDFSFVEEETRNLYSADAGRPSYPPEQIFRVLFLAYFYNLSDVRISQELQYNLLYRYFCRFGIDDDTPDDTTLVVFRKRLGEERFLRLFNRIVEKAKELGLLKEERKLIDATIIRADAALRNRTELLRHGRRRVIRELKGKDPQRAEELRRFVDAVETKELSREEVVAREEALTEEMLEALDDVTDEGVQYWLGELRKVKEGEGGVASFTDPDCRWGYKRKDEPFLGYKAHVSCDESGIVTSVQVLPGNASECEHLGDLLKEDLRKGIGAKSVVADKAYDSSENRNKIKEQGMAPEIPSRYSSKQANKFKYRPRKDCFRCPGGKETIGKSAHRGGSLYYFSEADCQKCRLRETCLGKAKTRKRVYLSWRTRDVLVSHQDLKEALKSRKKIERKFGEAKWWHQMRRARYRGKWRVGIQVIMTFIVLNVKRVIRLIASGPPTEEGQLATAVG